MARGFALITACAALVLAAGCRPAATGPIAVSAIGGPPQLVNPNLQPLDPASAYLLEAAAQGLVRFDGAGEIEPALAQSWIVSDDGRRYTFRIRRTIWADGSRVTAEQVASRLSAAFSRASRNPLKPVLGAIESVVPMTDQVLEISLRGPRPHLLELLAQPEMAIILTGGMPRGTGPYRVAGEDGVVRLSRLSTEDEGEIDPDWPEILLRGEPAALAVARFAEGHAELVTGGTIGDLAIARAADLPNSRLGLDRPEGLFGLAFATAEGPFAEPELRRALSMALDRPALVEALNVPGLRPRVALVPVGIAEYPRPAMPDWAGLPLAELRARARRTVAALDTPLRLRVAMPAAPGYRLAFAYLRRDWRLIGVEAERVDPGTPAELRLVDAVAPTTLSTWYLRHFTCEASPVCDAAADQALFAARFAPTARDRSLHLANADQALVALTPYIPITSPLRWSLVSPRLTGFRPNPFARHPPGTLIAQRF